jgi:hypothetical protein
MPSSSASTMEDNSEVDNLYDSILQYGRAKADTEVIKKIYIMILGDINQAHNLSRHIERLTDFIEHTKFDVHEIPEDTLSWWGCYEAIDVWTGEAFGNIELQSDYISFILGCVELTGC